MSINKKFIVDGVILLTITIIILYYSYDYLSEQNQRMEERVSYLEDREFFKKSSFSGIVFDKSFNRYRNTYYFFKLKLFEFERLRYNYSYDKFDFKCVRDSIATLYVDKEMYYLLQIGDIVEKEKDSLSIKINTINYNYYERFPNPFEQGD